MKSVKEKISYCIGLKTGLNLLEQFAEVDSSLLQEGFQDALKQAKPRLEPKEIEALLASLQQQVTSQQKQRVMRLSEENKKASEQFFKENKGVAGVQALGSGLQYTILSSGPGQGEHPTLFDTVKIHYRGSLLDGRLFDSSYQRGEPLAIPLGRAIAGWGEALQLMRVGDKWKVFIPPYLAYGESGFGPEIPPNAALIFEIELLEIQKG